MTGFENIRFKHESDDRPKTATDIFCNTLDRFLENKRSRGSFRQASFLTRGSVLVEGEPYVEEIALPPRKRPYIEIAKSTFSGLKYDFHETYPYGYLRSQRRALDPGKTTIDRIYIVEAGRLEKVIIDEWNLGQTEFVPDEQIELMTSRLGERVGDMRPPSGMDRLLHPVSTIRDLGMMTLGSPQCRI